MQDPFRTIEWREDHIRLLDQTLLPREEKYLDIYDVDVLCEAIKRLSVRGAPAIGVAAAMGVALGMLEIGVDRAKDAPNHFEHVCSKIGKTRPYSGKSLLGAGTHEKSLLHKPRINPS